MTKATSLCWLWPQLLSGPDIKNISFIWCLPALLRHISVPFTRLEKEQIKPPVQWASSPVLTVDSICSCSFLQTALSDSVTSSYTCFWWEQCPSGWIGSASSCLSTLKNSIAWILFPEIGYIPTFLQGISPLSKYCQLHFRKNKPKPAKSPPCSSLPCRGTRCEMQHGLETGHCIACLTYSKLEMAGVFSLSLLLGATLVLVTLRTFIIKT